MVVVDDTTAVVIADVRTASQRADHALAACILCSVTLYRVDMGSARLANFPYQNGQDELRK